MKFVISTLTNPFIFVNYKPGAKNSDGQTIGMAQAMRRIIIHGGANRPNTRGMGEYTTDNNGLPMWTPRGVVTPVDDLDIEWLVKDPGFSSFMRSGHIKIENKDISGDVNKINKAVEAGMAPRDSMAPLVPGDPRFQKKLDPSADLDPNDNNKPLTPAQLQELLGA